MNAADRDAIRLWAGEPGRATRASLFTTLAAALVRWRRH
jgi:hypothetical protein